MSRPTASPRQAIFAILVPIALLAGCFTPPGPDLDVTVRDLDAAAILERIETHGDRVKDLSEADLGVLADFLEEYAGEAVGPAPGDEPGRVLFLRSGCVSCHQLKAGNP